MKTSLLHHSHFTFSAAVVLMTGTLQAAEPSEIKLVRDGKHQEVSEKTRSTIAERLPKYFATCSFNSRDHPRVFASWLPPTIWEDTEAKDHLTIHFSKPIEIRAGTSPVSSVQQILLGLDNPRFPGPELTRHGERVVAYLKCSGNDLIGFVCAPDLKAVMPSSYHWLCPYAVRPEQDDAQPGYAPDRLPAGSHPPTNGR